MAIDPQQQLDALNAAIASGATELQMGQERIRYRSIDEMIRIANRLEKQIGKTRRAVLTPTYDKGL